MTSHGWGLQRTDRRNFSNHRRRRAPASLEGLEDRTLLSITVGDARATQVQGGTSALFVVSLSAPGSQKVSVDYDTGDLTAVSGVDYKQTTGAVSFAPGETGKTVSVPVLFDDQFQPSRTFTLNLLNPVGDTIADPRGVGTILSNNSSPSVSVTNNVNPLVVTSTSDAGPGSLRQAILAANSSPTPASIGFAIPGVGPFTIAVRSPLPVVTSPVTIDATTQPGYSGAPVVELNGAGAGAGVNGLTVTAGNTTIRGLAINQFGALGIDLEGRGGT